MERPDLPRRAVAELFAAFTLVFLVGGAAVEVGAGAASSAWPLFVIMAVATDTRAVGAGAAIGIGAVVTVDIMVGGGISGASMNPARSFGPALASGTWGDFWIYAIGPVFGTVGAALLYQVIRSPGPARA